MLKCYLSYIVMRSCPSHLQAVLLIKSFGLGDNCCPTWSSELSCCLGYCNSEQDNRWVPFV